MYLGINAFNLVSGLTVLFLHSSVYSLFFPFRSFSIMYRDFSFSNLFFYRSRTHRMLALKSLKKIKLLESWHSINLAQVIKLLKQST